MKFCLLSLVLAFIWSSSLAQTANMPQLTTVDSLVGWVSQNLQNQIIDSAQFYKNARKAIRLSEELNDKKLLAMSYRNLAMWYYNENTIDSTANNLQKALTIYQELNADSLLATTHLELEDANKLRANYSQAMTHDFSALALYEKINDQRGIANCYTRLCDLMYYQEKYQEGAEYCQKAIEIQQKLDLPEDLAISFRYKADNLLILEHYGEALRNINEAISELRNAGKTDYDIMPAYNTRGNIYKYLKRYDEALSEYKKNYELSKTGQLDRYLIPSLGNIGHVYRLQENYAAALPYTLEAIEIMKRTGNTQNLWENYLHAADCYEALGQYKNALAYERLYYEEDSEKKKDIIKQLESELQIKYETAKKDERIEEQDAQISQQKKVKILSISIAGLLATILFGMYVSMKNIREKREKLKLLNLELERKRKDVEISHATLSKSLDELKATQNQLIHAEKMASLGELTAGIAHEIQNPLNFVNNFSEVNMELIEELEEEMVRGNYQEARGIANDIKENENKILHHGNRADSIVKGMLQHSRSNTGEKTPTDINALSDEYLRLAYHGFRAKDKSFNADFKSEFDENLPKINVIPQDIGRVLLNLINNAFHAVSSKALASEDRDYNPTVKVKTELAPLEGGLGGDTGAKITITDNGPGIPEEIKDKIFQPFFTTKPTGEGTGLGLSLSYDIIKAHGGRIELNSNYGEGTKFIIFLPLT